MERKVGLVLEGGGFRGVFTEGILECLLEEEICLPYVIGVSMGAINGGNYISRQKKRNYDIMMTYLNDHRYVSMKNMITKGSLFGMDFLFKDVAYELNPFDFKTFHQSDQELVIGAMSCHSGLTDYFYKSEMDDSALLMALRASSSLPFLSQKVCIKGVEYLDGGVSDSIPVRQAFADGCEKVIVILTRHQGYERKPFSYERIGNMMYRAHPAVVQAMKRRHVYYKETTEYLEKLEKEGLALVIRPPKPILLERAEKDREKIRATYLMGYNYGKEVMDQIKSFTGDLVEM
ncbi:MAG: patatin family protein [Firmicutes bacterium HGW-Firmicutes-2]|jgi:predicted patatin/cPLA2 family phospholipase|nr:MAG: patatin family protein [Firmicutes bacterium HGW-Firmicutes-2]